MAPDHVVPAWHSMTPVLIGRRDSARHVFRQQRQHKPGSGGGSAANGMGGRAVSG
jgi:hypothetical protein